MDIAPNPYVQPLPGHPPKSLGEVRGTSFPLGGIPFRAHPGTAEGRGKDTTEQTQASSNSGALPNAPGNGGSNPTYHHMHTKSRKVILRPKTSGAPDQPRCGIVVRGTRSRGKRQLAKTTPHVPIGTLTSEGAGAPIKVERGEKIPTLYSDDDIPELEPVTPPKKQVGSYRPLGNDEELFIEALFNCTPDIDLQVKALLEPDRYKWDNAMYPPKGPTEALERVFAAAVTGAQMNVQQARMHVVPQRFGLKVSPLQALRLGNFPVESARILSGSKCVPESTPASMAEISAADQQTYDRCVSYLTLPNGEQVRREGN